MSFLADYLEQPEPNAESVVEIEDSDDEPNQTEPGSGVCVDLESSDADDNAELALVGPCSSGGGARKSYTGLSHSQLVRVAVCAVARAKKAEKALALARQVTPRASCSSGPSTAHMRSRKGDDLATFDVQLAFSKSLRTEDISKQHKCPRARVRTARVSVANTGMQAELELLEVWRDICSM